MGNLRNLFGIGPFLLFLCIAIEGIIIYSNQWISLPINLSLSSQIILTILSISILLSGMAWFNYSLNLIKVNFLDGENKLVVRGPFNYVRHPLYSTLIFALPPLAVVWFADLLFVVPWILIFIVAHFIVELEERGLAKQFGKSYEKYRQYVPALLPYKGSNGKRYYSEIMNGCEDSEQKDL